MNTGERTGNVERWLACECSSRLAQALDAMAITGCQVERLPETTPAPAALSWWRQPLSLGPGAELWVGAPEQAWLTVGRKALQAAGIDEADPADLKSTWHEILTQALSATAQAIGARLGREAVCQPGRESADAPETGAGFPVEMRFADGETARAVLAFPPPVLEALQGPENAGGAPASDGSVAVRGSKTLDLLLEVELPVSVSFGRAQLPLRDVLKLTTGSIVEMNRSVSEPVEVIVNNCVIARGEVVVVEGNYGVRIQQIISRQERLRSLN